MKSLNQTIGRELHLIVADHCPSDDGPTTAALRDRAARIIEDPQLNVSDRTTIVRILPPALLSMKSLTPLLRDSTVGSDLVLHLFQSHKKIPCDSAAVGRAEMLTWLGQLCDAMPTGSVQRQYLLHSYLRCCTSQHVRADDAKLSNRFLELFSILLKNYDSNPVHDVTPLENLQRLPIVDFMISSVGSAPSMEGAPLCVYLLQEIILNGDIAAFKVFREKYGNAARPFPFPLTTVETITRNIAAQVYVQSSHESIPFKTLLEIFYGSSCNVGGDAETSQKLSSHKIMVQLLEQGACKLDDVNGLVIPCVMGTKVGSGSKTLEDAQATLRQWRDAAHEIIIAIDKAQQQE